MTNGLRVTVWNEGVHERNDERVRKLYPDGIGGQIANYLRQQPGIASVRVSELFDPDQGLSEDILANTDVMTWWGHKAHHEVTEENAQRVQDAVVKNGMGLLVLHSGHFSKPFIRLMGTSCSLKWREWQGIGEKERLWIVDPAHPIAHGLPEYFELERAEMYGEHFDIPQPDHLITISWFQGGEVFRSCCTWHRGLGKVVYFRPGHETLPIYYNPNILKLIHNAVRWLAPTRTATGITRRKVEPLEKME
jgi:trehalose utilization protein